MKKTINYKKEPPSDLMGSNPTPRVLLVESYFLLIFKVYLYK